MKHNRQSLKETIRVLEIRQKREHKELNHQLRHTYENLRPFNLIKNSVQHLFHNSTGKGGLLESFLPFISTFISGKILRSRRHNKPLSRVVSTAVQMAVARLTAQYSPYILHFAGEALDKVTNILEKNQETRTAHRKSRTKAEPQESPISNAESI